MTVLSSATLVSTEMFECMVQPSHPGQGMDPAILHGYDPATQTCIMMMYSRGTGSNGMRTHSWAIGALTTSQLEHKEEYTVFDNHSSLRERVCIDGTLAAMETQRDC
jgi:hypothetical protein